MTRRLVCAGLFSLALALALGAAASASGHRTVPSLTVAIAGEPRLGATVTAEARLADAAGRPVRGAEIAFVAPAEWGEIQGDVALGSARTDAGGAARLAVRLRMAGAVEVGARFAGDDRFEPAVAAAELDVRGDQQLYDAVMPAVSTLVGAAGSWSLAAILATVWALYVFVARLVLNIATASDDAPRSLAPLERRRLLGLLVPTAMHALTVPVGVGLVTVVARSPYTHTNLEGHRPGSAYARTPYAHVPPRERMTMAMPRDLPAVLQREVSFAGEVLPLFRRRAGPHAHQPKNSPPPKGVRLDAYAPLMEHEGLVVPGKPAESELVRVLVDDAMRMPPSLPPLPDGEIQVIVSWIAQGAKDN